MLVVLEVLGYLVLAITRGLRWRDYKPSFSNRSRGDGPGQSSRSFARNAGAMLIITKTLPVSQSGWKSSRASQLPFSAQREPFNHQGRCRQHLDYSLPPWQAVLVDRVYSHLPALCWQLQTRQVRVLAVPERPLRLLR
jgi:hypothetical protein